MVTNSTISGYYQLPEDASPATKKEVDIELIDYVTGAPLVDPDTQETLTAVAEEPNLLSSSGNFAAVTIANDSNNPVPVEQTNINPSEVSTSLLGIPRTERAQVLFDTVNIYDINTKEWQSLTSYTYFRDPTEYTFDGEYGYYHRHLPAESAIQVYAYPPPTSFSYPIDDGTGRFPGGYSNGVASVENESRRAFRYQPGKIIGFTLGVKTSTNSGYIGEVLRWGCRNAYGDAYYFELKAGINLSIVRTSTNLPGGREEVPQSEWNGDKVLIDDSETGWVLDLSRVTMFKIEFGWYGAVGATFYAYLPVAHNEARWVKLHQFSAENKFTVPSLRSPFLKFFTSARTTAGTTKPAFVNLYGSSVYIDGGDDSGVVTGAISTQSPKVIDSNSRSLLGITPKFRINGVANQKIVYPCTLTAYSSVPARIDVVINRSTCGNTPQFGYGRGMILSRGASAAINATRIGSRSIQVASGSIPDISGELLGDLNYLNGRRVRVTAAGVFDTHVTSVSDDGTVLTLNRDVPSTLTSIRLSRLDAFAVKNSAINSATTSGVVTRLDTGGFWRIGLWPQAAGSYDSTKQVVWGASSYSALRFSLTGQVIGQIRVPTSFNCNNATSFSINIDSFRNTYVLTFGENSISGTGSPFPISLVVEMMDSSSMEDITIFEGNWEAQGSGIVTSITAFDQVSGLTENTALAGGSSYVAHKFEGLASNPLSAALVDVQGYKVMSTSQSVVSYFLGANQTKEFDLRQFFGPSRMFTPRRSVDVPLSASNRQDAIFVVATSLGNSGSASASIIWEEQ